MVQQTKVFVGSLPQGSRPEELRRLFERFGGVTECDVMNRIGFVHMETEDQAEAAIEALNNSTFNGGVITVERGRIKERGQRGGGFGGGRGGRGGMRGGGGDRRGGGPMRGGGRGPPRDAPYMRDRGMGGGMRGAMGMRNGGGYDRGGADYNDRYNGYGGGAGGYEDRRGFSMSQDPYAAAPAPYDDQHGYGAPPVDDMRMYGDDRRGVGGYADDLVERRPPMRGSAMGSGGGYDRAPRQGGMGMGGGYDRAPRAEPVGGSYDMYSRRPAVGGGGGGYDRDAYAAPQYGSGPRMGGGGGRGGGGGMGRRY